MRGLPPGSGVFNLRDLTDDGRVAGQVQRWRAKGRVREGAVVVEPDGTYRYAVRQERSGMRRILPDGSLVVSLFGPRMESHTVLVRQDRILRAPYDAWRMAISASGRTWAVSEPPSVRRDGVERWLDRPAFDNVEITGVNDHGVAVGTASNADPAEEARYEGALLLYTPSKDVTPYVWVGERAYRLADLCDLPGVLLGHASDVNGRGQIAASGSYRGRWCVFRLTPATRRSSRPSPSSSPASCPAS